MIDQKQIAELEEELKRITYWPLIEYGVNGKIDCEQIIQDLIEEVKKLQHHNEELQSLNSMQEMRIGQLEQLCKALGKAEE